MLAAIGNAVKARNDLPKNMNRGDYEGREEREDRSKASDTGVAFDSPMGEKFLRLNPLGKSFLRVLCVLRSHFPSPFLG